MIQLEIKDHEYQINSNNCTSLTSVHIKLSSVDNVFLHETLETLITWSSKEIIKLYHGKIISYFHSWKPRVDSNWGEQHFNTDSKAVKKQKRKEKSLPWVIVWSLVSFSSLSVLISKDVRSVEWCNHETTRLLSWNDVVWRLSQNNCELFRINRLQL